MLAHTKRTIPKKSVAVAFRLIVFKEVYLKNINKHFDVVLKVEKYFRNVFLSLYIYVCVCLCVLWNLN